ncbi:Mu-like prophage major head subunit gpT family protein, partial [Helicobacter suis]|uniref:Mu-like prophage major head subunit gpT family protein n=1 Tax=Helicobacter suis TaxID=104628 RepID=UPI001966E588
MGAQVAGMADLIIDHYNAMVFGLFNTNLHCYDGVDFFSDKHPIGDTDKTTNTAKTASNKGSHNLDQQGLLESRMAMMCYQNEDGRPLNIVPNLLLIPPSLESAAMQLLKAPTLANGAANICYNLMEYLVCPYLNDNRWILLDTSKT